MITKGKNRTNKSAVSEISVGLQHRQSKLDLLDNTLLTSFPLPKIDNDSSINSIYCTKNKEHQLTDSLTSNNESVSTCKGLKLNHISENKYASNLDCFKSDKYSPILSSMTISSDKTTYSINNSDKIKSITNSLTSKTFKPSSKITTPPSSLDYESSFYDYRLVLAESENIIKKLNKSIYRNEENDKIERDYEENCLTTVNQSLHTDKYIQSLYQDLINKDCSATEIQCMICKSPVFEDSDYFNKILEFKGVVCENCFRKNDKSRKPSFYAIDSNNFESKQETPSRYIDDTIYSLDETSHTIQLHFDITENEEINDSHYYGNDLYEDDEDTTEYGIYQNINFLRDSNNNIDKFQRSKDDNIEKVIRKLKRIERTDLRIRQSIADLRSSGQSQFGINYQYNENYSSFWSLIKKTFTNNS